MTKPNYNERKALKNILTKWYFDVVAVSDLDRGDIIIDNGQYRQVAATMSHMPDNPQGPPSLLFLAFENDPHIEKTEIDRMVVKVSVTRSASPEKV